MRRSRSAKSTSARTRPRGEVGFGAAALILVVALAGVGAFSVFGHSVDGAIARDAMPHRRSAPGAVGSQAAAFDELAALGRRAGEVAERVERADRVSAQLPAPGSLYGNETLYWNLAKEGTLLFGGQRALLLQVADPRVAAGVAKYSSFAEDPFGRLSRTLDAMVAITFGTPEERTAMLRHLEELHRNVRGRTADGKAYSAMDPRLMFWIHATLVDTALEVEKRFSGKFSELDRARYYDETKALARAFDIPDKYIPEDYAAFQRYMQSQFETLRPSSESREIADFLLRPKVGILPKSAFAPLAWITRDLMPTELRKAYDLKRLAPHERAAVRATELAVRNFVPPVADALVGNRLVRSVVFKLTGTTGRRESILRWAQESGVIPPNVPVPRR